MQPKSIPHALTCGHWIVNNLSRHCEGVSFCGNPPAIPRGRLFFIYARATADQPVAKERSYYGPRDALDTIAGKRHRKALLG